MYKNKSLISHFSFIVSTQHRVTISLALFSSPLPLSLYRCWFFLHMFTHLSDIRLPDRTCRTRNTPAPQSPEFVSCARLDQRPLFD